MKKSAGLASPSAAMVAARTRPSPRFQCLPQYPYPGPTVASPDLATYPVSYSGYADCKTTHEIRSQVNTRWWATAPWNDRQSGSLSRRCRSVSTRQPTRTVRDNGPMGLLNPSGNGRCGVDSAFGLDYVTMPEATHAPGCSITTAGTRY